MAGTLSATVTQVVATENIAAGLSGVGAFTPEAIASYGASAALAGSGALTAPLKPVYEKAAALSGGGTLSAPAPMGIYARSAALSGGGTLSATAIAATPVLPYVDLFNRANASTLGSGWTTYSSGSGFDGTGAIVGNAAASTSGAAAAEAYVLYNTAMPNDDMEVSVVIGTLLGSTMDQFGIHLGANTAGERASLICDGLAGAAYIVSSSDWAGTTQATQASPTDAIVFAPGDRFALKRIGNVYTATQNYVPILTWTDSGNVVPRNSTHRYTGMWLMRDNADYRPIDSWKADAPITPVVEINTARSGQAVPAGINGVVLTLVGAGGGGGSGRKGNTSTARGGGSGGGAGAYFYGFIPAANLGSTYSVTVATAATNGGAAQVTASTNGVAGTNGAAVSFISGSTNVTANGGAQGAGGTTGVTAGGAGGTVSNTGGTATDSSTGSSGGNGGTNSGVTIGATNADGAAGGGGGSGASTGNARTAGGGGGTTTTRGGIKPGGAGGSAAGSAGSPGAVLDAYPGSGAGGGSASTTAAFGGGAGRGLGAGGGGGSSSIASTNSAAGGTGGPGYVKIEFV